MTYVYSFIHCGSGSWHARHRRITVVEMTGLVKINRAAFVGLTKEVGMFSNEQFLLILLPGVVANDDLFRKRCIKNTKKNQKT
jgi:hypothetical protein